jgi:hypothetical protein
MRPLQRRIPKARLPLKPLENFVSAIFKIVLEILMFHFNVNVDSFKIKP